MMQGLNYHLTNERTCNCRNMLWYHMRNKGTKADELVCHCMNVKYKGQLWKLKIYVLYRLGTPWMIVSLYIATCVGGDWRWFGLSNRLDRRSAVGGKSPRKTLYFLRDSWTAFLISFLFLSHKNSQQPTSSFINSPVSGDSLNYHTNNKIEAMLPKQTSVS